MSDEYRVLLRSSHRRMCTLRTHGLLFVVLLSGSSGQGFSQEQSTDVDASREHARELAQQDKPLEAIKVSEQTLAEARSRQPVPFELIAEILSDLGVFHRMAGQPDQALKRLLESRTNMQKSKTLTSESGAVVDGMIAQLCFAQKKYSDSKVACERSLQTLREIGKPENDMSSLTLYNLLAQINFVMEDFEGAKKHLEKALTISEATFGVEAKQTESALHQCFNFTSKHYPKDGVIYGKRLLGIFEQSGRNETREASAVHFRLLFAYSSLDEPDQLVKHAKTSIRIMEGLPSIPRVELALSYYAAGQALSKTVNLADARNFMKRAIDLTRQANPDDPNLPIPLQSYANVCGLLYDFDAALPAIEEAVAILKKIHGKDSTDYGNALLQYADLLSDSKQHGVKATETFRQAIAVLEKSLGKNNVTTAKAYHQFGSHLWLARDMDAAKKYLQEAVDIASSNPEIGESVANAFRNSLGAVLELDGDPAMARENYRQAFERVKDRDPSDTNYTAVLHNLSVSELMNGDVATAIRQQKIVRRGIHQYVQRLLPGLPEADQLHYLGQLYKLRLHVALSFIMHDAVASSTTVEAQNIAAETAEWLINGKGLTVEALAGRMQRLTSSDDPRAQQLRDVLKQRASLAIATPSTDTKVIAHLDQLAEREQQLARELGDTIYPRVETWIDVATIREQLTPTQVLIEFAKFSNYNFDFKVGQERYFQARYAAWVIPAAGQGDVQVIDLGTALEIDSTIGRIAASYSNAASILELVKSAGEAEATRQWRIDAANIKGLVWDKISDKLPQDTNTLILSPDSSLWQLPWAAMPLEDGKVLVEDFAIRYVVSGRELSSVNRSSVRQNPSLIFADPDYNLSVGENEKSVREIFKDRTPQSGLRSAGLASGMNLPPAPQLPHTRLEAEAIKPNLEKISEQPPQLYVGKWALESVLKAVRSPKYVVLSTHGFFLPEEQADTQAALNKTETDMRSAASIEVRRSSNPLLRCGLQLAGCNTGKYALGEDGVLTGIEVVNLDLRGTEMVILSACDTGVGRVNNGEGVAGLRQAFQLAGAGSVVSSLWQVEDTETAKLMSQFFENLANGMIKSEALRQAQLTRIKARRERHGAAHPFFWAAFTLTGKD